MNSDKLDEIFQGFDERMRNMAVFSPILGLDQKNRFKELHLPSLGMGVMLFILESMLLNKYATNETISQFLQEVLHVKYSQPLSAEEIQELRVALVDEFLRNRGAKHVYEYYDFKNKKPSSYMFDLIEYATGDLQELKSGLVKLQLTAQGVEMLFKTKEMYSEMQISIAQLYFKQQMQKGLFHEARRAVQDLALSIQTEKRKLKELQVDIARDVLSVAKQNLLEKQLHSMGEKMKTEKEVFQDLKSVVSQALESYYKGGLSRKEEKGIDLILQIQRQLLNVVSLHESLFTEKQRVQSVMSSSLQSLITNAFSVKLNFRKEVLGQLPQSRASIETIRQVVAPLLPLKINRSFHPGVSFEPHKRAAMRIENDQELPRLEEEDILKMEEEEKRQEAEQDTQAQFFFERLIVPLLKEEQIRISSLLEQWKEEDPDLYQRIITSADFYSFLISLHQSDQSDLDVIEPDLLPHVSFLARAMSKTVERFPELKNVRSFSIQPLVDVIRLESGYVLSDFILKRGVPDDVGTK